jgi:hypothetical protein
VSYLDELLAIDADPILIWRLEETSGTVAEDSGIDNRDGTYVETFTHPDGIVNDSVKALGLEAATGDASGGVRRAGEAAFLPTNFTLIFWLKLRTAVSGDIVNCVDQDIGGGGANAEGWVVQYANPDIGDLLGFSVFTAPTTQTDYQIKVSPSVGVRHMCAVTYDSAGDVNLYFDNVGANGGASQGVLAGVAANTPFIVGTSIALDSFQLLGQPDAIVDEVSYHSTLFTAQNISDLWTAGSAAAAVTYTVVNGTLETLSNVNAAGVDVASMSYRQGVALNDTELAALCATKGVMVFADDLTHAETKAIWKAGKYLNTLA